MHTIQRARLAEAFAGKRDWPKRDWPKRGWPKRDWPKRDWPKRDWPKRDWAKWAAWDPPPAPRYVASYTVPRAGKYELLVMAAREHLAASPYALQVRLSRMGYSEYSHGVL